MHTFAVQTLFMEKGFSIHDLQKYVCGELGPSGLAASG